MIAGAPSTSSAVVNGNAVIRRPFDNSEIAITTTDRLAGAIHSLTWNNKEFIDSTDHGRQLQSACSFDCGLDSPFWAECFNPTEAGSRRDGAGPTSTSKLLTMDIMPSGLRTKTQMAFWLAPNEDSSSRPALNNRVLSDHILEKRIRIGYQSMPNVIEYEVIFTVPIDESHRFAQFEALTGYMPNEFSRFWTFDIKTKELQPLSDGPGEQSRPVILATEAGTHAMGVYSHEQPAKGYANAGYGRFRFAAEKVVKWNCVFRVRDESKIRSGDYRYRILVAVGSLAQVHSTMLSLSDEKN